MGGNVSFIFPSQTYDTGGVSCKTAILPQFIEADIIGVHTLENLSIFHVLIFLINKSSFLLLRLYRFYFIFFFTILVYCPVRLCWSLFSAGPVSTIIQQFWLSLCTDNSVSRKKKKSLSSISLFTAIIYTHSSTHFLVEKLQLGTGIEHKTSYNRVSTCSKL